MRLRSIHPKFLDNKGLVACWRESLLAKKILEGKTKGYKNHPQLIRFKQSTDPIGFINAYIAYLWNEADSRGYKFDRSKIGETFNGGYLAVNKGQVIYEFKHLLNKLSKRNENYYAKNLNERYEITVNPLFKLIEGNKESWEK